jgi:hypothetical protein
VEDLKVEFVFEDLKVFLANEYQEGSCEHYHIREHENEHVRIYREVYAKYQPLLEQAVAAARGQIPLKTAPVTVVSREEGGRVVKESIDAVVDPIFERFDQELEDENAKIDTAASYDELRRRCSGW